MNNNAEKLIDIHTHRPCGEADERSIVNYSLLCANAALPTEEGYYSAGIHPCELTEQNAAGQLNRLRLLIDARQLVAIGEAGLDKLSAAPMDLQMEILKKQVECAENGALPLIIHCVRAMQELLAVRRQSAPRQPWIWHGFRGTPEQARQLLDKGFYLSFGRYYSDKSLALVPADRLFLETDTAPDDIEMLLQQAATVRRVTPDELRRAIQKNIRNVFFKYEEL